MKRLAAGSESNLLLSKYSTAPKGKKKRVSESPFYIFVLLISAGFTSQCCGSLLFLEIPNAGFSDKGGSVVC